MPACSEAGVQPTVFCFLQTEAVGFLSGLAGVTAAIAIAVLVPSIIVLTRRRPAPKDADASAPIV